MGKVTTFLGLFGDNDPCVDMEVSSNEMAPGRGAVAIAGVAFSCLTLVDDDLR